MSQKTGCIPVDVGFRFSVWAPQADGVYVVGDFNDWDPSSQPMEKHSDGVWATEISGAQVGDQYRYRIINGDQELLRIDPRARQVTNSVGNAIVTALSDFKEEKPFSTPKLHEMVIYELHIGTFGKTEGTDGPGTIKKATERLGYLKDLGINAVEVMPVSEFAGSFSWGYNPAHLFAIESDYGTPQDFCMFVQEAHRLGIAVIMDVVYNHFGPDDLDLWQFDGWSENDKGGIYFYNDWRSSTPWGETRPDYGRKEVREFIRDHALMWFETYGVDGLRWDMTAFIRNADGRNDDPTKDLEEGWSLMQWVNEEIKKRKPDAVLFAEDLQGNGFLTKHIPDGGAGFDSQWASSFVHTVRKILVDPEDETRDMEEMHHAIAYRYALDAYERVIYTESHDEVANGKARVPEEIDPGNASSWAAKKKSCLGAGLVFTTPGVPMIFQGQEFLEDDWFHDQDPIDWSRKDAFAGVLKLYKDLIALRLNRGGQTKGLTGQHVDVYHLDQENKVIAYHRWFDGGPGDSVVVIANLSTRPYEGYLLGFPSPGRWKVWLNSDHKGYDKSFGDMGGQFIEAETLQEEGLPTQARIDIGPYSLLILSQER